MRILVTGAGGLLGGEVVRAAASRSHETVALTRADLDVTNARAVAASVRRHAPDAIVFCAAYAKVDRAEQEPDVAMAVNRDGARNVAEAAGDAPMVYVSTDYVFDGKSRRPYLPDDDTGPLSAYARSKVAGEEAVRAVGRGWIVARTSRLYSGASGFVPMVLRRAARREPMRIVNDQTGRPTWAPDAARALVELVERDVRGVWHVTGGGECTYYELAHEAARLAGYDAAIESVSTAEFAAPAGRPAYSVLDIEATERLLGRRMIDWREALERYVSRDWRALSRSIA
jgi:dTDP-4-dehydrorhamnose reductase